MISQWTSAGMAILVVIASTVTPSSTAGEDHAAGLSGWRASSGGRSSVRRSGASAAIKPASHERSLRPRAGGGMTGNMLPNEHGQIWREYDISPYTSRVDDAENPEQAVRDWILRETGTEAWFSEPLGLLSVTRDRLRVYHTHQMHATVSAIVERFVANADPPHAFSVRLMTLGSPAWRAKAQEMMRLVPVQTPGVEAWVLSKEDAARLATELRRRSDAVEHNSPNLLLRHGQTHAISRTRPLPYIRSVQRRHDAWPNYQLRMGQIEEGITVELSPLLSRDRQNVDAVLKFTVVQLEKLTPVSINVPSAVDPRQRTQVQVPQVSSWHIHERFRWPTDEVLLISCGMVPAPAAARPSTPGLPTKLFGPARADALLLVEAKGPAANSVPRDAAEPRTGSLRYRGRY